MNVRNGGRSAGPRASAALLTAQLGAHAAARFAQRIEPLGLTRPQSALLQAIDADPGRSQQAVAERLGIHPSRVVALVDELEGAGIVERRRNPQDRRHYALHLVEKGRAALDRLARAAADHEADFSAALTDEEHAQLVALLQRIADQQGLTDVARSSSRNAGDSG